MTALPSSSPSSPPLSPSDVFASRSPSPDQASRLHRATGRAEPNEQPLLQRTHYTQGYRAGISDGKDDPVIAQRGFDDGFPVGAALALRAGWILAVLEESVRSGGTVAQAGTAEADIPDLTELLQEARQDLSLESLVTEMQGLGMLADEGAVESDVYADSNAGKASGSHTRDIEQGFAEKLPSIRKWDAKLLRIGLKSRPG